MRGIKGGVVFEDDSCLVNRGRGIMRCLRGLEIYVGILKKNLVGLS